jgi:hypothetical protein
MRLISSHGRRSYIRTCVRLGSISDCSAAITREYRGGQATVAQERNPPYWRGKSEDALSWFQDFRDVGGYMQFQPSEFGGSRSRATVIFLSELPLRAPGMMEMYTRATVSALLQSEPKYTIKVCVILRCLANASSAPQASCRKHSCQLD